MSNTSPDQLTLLSNYAGHLAAFGAPLEETRAVLVVSAAAARAYPRRADFTDHLAEAPQIVVSGWACQMRPEARRGRQIFGFILPGDVIGSFWRPPEFAFCRLVALTRLITVPASPLLALDPDGRLLHPDVVRAARRAEDYAHHRLFDQLVRLGSRDAYAGLAHLLLELYGRLARVGLAQGGEFLLPVGQRVLAQAMGFSVAHTNHTLQRMTADGLFCIRGEVVRLLQLERMASVAEFEPSDPQFDPHGEVAALWPERAAGSDDVSEPVALAR